jgi:hypothetical protein
MTTDAPHHGPSVVVGQGESDYLRARVDDRLALLVVLHDG